MPVSIVIEFLLKKNYFTFIDQMPLYAFRVKLLFCDHTHLKKWF